MGKPLSEYRLNNATKLKRAFW